MKTVYIVRGLPGSGKSYLASQLNQNPNHVCCADDFLMENGQYVFSDLGVLTAHRKCKNKYASLLHAGIDNIVVANTNVKLKYLDIYVVLAYVANYKILLVEPDTSWRYDVDECFVRNTHGVSLETLQSMRDSYVSNKDCISYFRFQYPLINLGEMYGRQEKV
jgi:predicted kinase